MKICPKCKSTKPNDSFNLNRSRPDGLAIHCRDCMKAFQKANYANSDKRRRAIRYRDEESKQARKNFIFDYLQKNPCVDCGEKDPVVLQFDHVTGKKSFAIGNTFRKGVSIFVLKEEISKCEVRCANCHQRKTAKEFGWWITKHSN
jgi:hypothetical protein